MSITSVDEIFVNFFCFMLFKSQSVNSDKNWGIKIKRIEKYIFFFLWKFNQL